MRRRLRYRGGDPDRHSFSLVVVGAIVVIAGAVFLGFQWGRYVEKNTPRVASPGTGAARGAGKGDDIRDASASAIRNEMSAFSSEAVKIPAVDPPPPAPSAREDLKKTETDATFPDTLSRKNVSPVSLDVRRENAVPPEAAGTGKYRLQAGAWKSRSAADTVRKRLAGGGYSAKVIRAVNRNRGEVFRVRVGPFASREEAEMAGKVIRSKFHVDVILLTN